MATISQRDSTSCYVYTYVPLLVIVYSILETVSAASTHMRQSRDLTAHVHTDASRLIRYTIVCTQYTFVHFKNTSTFLQILLM